MALSRTLIAAAGLLGLAALLGGCERSQPPDRPPDFEGTVIGRTPLLVSPPTPARLLVEAAGSRVPGGEVPPAARAFIELEAESLVLDALPEGKYRPAQATEAWIGRRVQVWYAPGAALASDVAQPDLPRFRAAAVAVHATR